MLLHLAFLPALIAVIMGLNNPPVISVGVKVAIEAPAQESETSISERRALRQRSRDPIPPEYCTPFQFSQCDAQSQQGNVIDIQDRRDAWDCSRDCARESKCNSWMFSKDGVQDISGKCWLVKTQAAKTVKELCNTHQGTVLPFNLVDQLESCLEVDKLHHRRCKVGECIQLKPQYKLGHEITDSETECKFKCEVKITPEPHNNCSNYSWNKETKQCTLFSIYETVSDRAAEDEWNCRIIAGTKNMTKSEVDNCYNYRVMCSDLLVSGATFAKPFANSDGHYKLTSERVAWAPEKPVFKHVSKDRYILYKPVHTDEWTRYKWIIGRRSNVKDSNFGGYHSSDHIDSSENDAIMREPWQVGWKEEVRVECL